MTDIETLRALIERVEGATAPDRHLDRDIEAAIGWPFALWTGEARPFTSVLDAAESLVPPVKWTLGSRHDLDANKRLWCASVNMRRSHQSVGATAALALTAAALRARLAELEQGSYD